MDINIKNYITIDEISSLIDKNKNYIYRVIRQTNIIQERFNKKIYIHKKDLDKIKNYKNKSKSKILESLLTVENKLKLNPKKEIKIDVLVKELKTTKKQFNNFRSYYSPKESITNEELLNLICKGKKNIDAKNKKTRIEGCSKNRFTCSHYLADECLNICFQDDEDNIIECKY